MIVDDVLEWLLVDVEEIWTDDGIVGTIKGCFCVDCWLDNRSFNEVELRIGLVDDDRSLGLITTIWWETIGEFDDNNGPQEGVIDWSVEDVCGKWWIVWDEGGGVDEREFIPES